MKKYLTNNGKEISPIVCNKTGHIKLQFSTGGELPQELSGLFTNEREVEIAVNIYLSKQKPSKSKEE